MRKMYSFILLLFIVSCTNDDETITPNEVFKLPIKIVTTEVNTQLGVPQTYKSESNYIYDSDSKLIEIRYANDFRITRDVNQIFVYNQQDKLIELQDYDDKGSLVGHRTLDYTGELITKMERYSNNVLSYWCDYQYDLSGNLVSENYSNFPESFVIDCLGNNQLKFTYNKPNDYSINHYDTKKSMFADIPNMDALKKINTRFYKNHSLSKVDVYNDNQLTETVVVSNEYDSDDYIIKVVDNDNPNVVLTTEIIYN